MCSVFVYIFIFFLYLGCSHIEFITDFFPEIKGNLTKITWAHAVNSKMKLNEALQSDDVMMLEADVSYGKVQAQNETMPIMAHPPSSTSDLSLEDFLTTVYHFNKNARNVTKKGIKLDFKTTDAFLQSRSLMEKIYQLVNFPFWINADIIKKTIIPFIHVVDPDKFLSNCKKFNHSLTVLSLGWTTGLPGIFSSYTNLQINKMIKTIQDNNITQPITFPVRAKIAANSRTQLNLLKEKIANCSITIWTTDIDSVNIKKLRELIFSFGLDRVYIDVPEKLKNRLNLGYHPEDL